MYANEKGFIASDGKENADISNKTSNSKEKSGEKKKKSCIWRDAFVTSSCMLSIRIIYLHANFRLKTVFSLEIFFSFSKMICRICMFYFNKEGVLHAGRENTSCNKEV